MKFQKRKIFIGIIFMLIIFWVNLIEVIAGSCRNATCGCRGYGITNCKVGNECWYNSAGSGGCNGHAWYEERRNIRSSSGAATCTSSGHKIITWDVYYGCGNCPANKTEPDQTGEFIPALGHQLSGWNYNSSSHWKNCTRPVGHSGSDQFDRGAHNFTNWYQNNDGYRHKYCTI